MKCSAYNLKIVFPFRINPYPRANILEGNGVEEEGLQNILES